MRARVTAMLCVFILLITAVTFGAVSLDHVQAAGLMQQLGSDASNAIC